MRIAILADPLDNQRAGVHVFTREMVDALLRLDHGHELILVREREEAGLEGARQFAVKNIRAPVGAASARLFFLVPWLLRRARVDVVIEPAHFGPFNLPREIRRVTIIHDLTPILFGQLHRWHSQALQKAFLPGILRHADLVVTNSDSTRNDVLEHFPFTRDKLIRLYPGVNRVYREPPLPGVAEALGLDAPFFLNVGTIEPRKNLVRLLEAYGRFRERSPERTLLAVAGGQGWRSDEFYRALRTHPFRSDIRLLGHVPLEYLPALYAGAVATVYPSLYEGFGLPLLESITCGTPVVTSPVSSMPEAAGEAGLYADPADAEQLADRLSAIAGNSALRARLAAACPGQAARFSWDDFARGLVDGVEQLLKEK